MKIDVAAVIKLDATKASGLETIAELSGSLMGFVGPMNKCQFTVNNTYNPASIYNPLYNAGDLKIEIAQWFLKGYSVGYIAGMLCHEVGAHFLTDSFMNKAAHKKEQDALTNKTKVQDGATGWTYTAAKATQPDHIFASCHGYERYTLYRELMIEFANIIAQLVGDSSSGKILFTDADLTDLIDCWLMDISSILSTSDARAWGVILPYSKYVADAHARHLAQLKTDANALTANAKVRNAIAAMQDKSTLGVLGEYVSMSQKLFARS
jgi:hypothetical protein